MRLLAIIETYYFVLSLFVLPFQYMKQNVTAKNDSEAKMTMTMMKIDDSDNDADVDD